MILYGHASELAIRAALFLSRQPCGKRSTAREVARSTGLPRPYLAKILRQLTAANLVRAYRGPGGGLELGGPARGITLRQIIDAVEGPVSSERCALGLRECTEKKPCRLHHHWKPLCRRMRQLLEQTTLAELAGPLGLAGVRKHDSTSIGGGQRIAKPHKAIRRKRRLT